MVSRNYTTQRHVFDDYLESMKGKGKLDVRSFNKLVNKGTQWLNLAGAASLYFIVIIAACPGLSRNFLQVVENDLGSLCAHLRDPRSGTQLLL